MFEQVFVLSFTLLTLYVAAYTFAAQQVAQRYSPRWLEMMRRPYAVAPLFMLSLGVGVAGYAVVHQAEWKSRSSQVEADTLAFAIGMVILGVAVVWIMGLWDSLFDVESPRNLSKILASDDLLYDVLYGMLARRDRVLWSRLLRKASERLEWVEALHQWLRDTPEALREPWLVQEAMSEFSRELQSGQAKSRWDVLRLLMDASLQHGAAEEALDRFQMVLLHLSVLKVWDSAHWNIMTTLAELFWRDLSGQPRIYLSEGVGEETQYMVTSRLERLCDLMLEVGNVNILNQCMTGVGYFVRDVADDNAVTLADRLVQRPGLLAALQVNALRELLNGLNFARRGPTAAYEGSRIDRQRVVDHIVNDVLASCRDRLERQIFEDLVRTGGMRIGEDGNWRSVFGQEAQGRSLPSSSRTLLNWIKKISSRRENTNELSVHRATVLEKSRD